MSEQLGSPHRRAGRTTRSEVIAFAGVILCVTLSVAFCFASDLPCIQDVPGHAALNALRHRLSSSPFEQQYYRYEPNFGPYWLFRTLGAWLTVAFGAVFAARLQSALPCIALPAAMFVARQRLWRGADARAQGANLPHATATLAFTLGLPLLMGLSAYLLGLAAFVYAAALWLHHLEQERPTLWARAKLASVATLVYLTHGHAFLLYAVVATTFALVPNKREGRPIALRLVDLGLMLLPASLLGVASVLSTGPGPAGETGLVFRGFVEKLSLLGTVSLMTRFGVDAVAGLLLAAGFVVSFVGAARTTAAPTTLPTTPPMTLASRHRLVAGAAILAVAFVFAPKTAGWFGYVDGRLVLPPLLLAVLGAAPPQTKNARWAPLLATLTILVTDHIALAGFRRESEGFRAATQAIPAETPVLYFPVTSESRYLSADPFRHDDKLLVVDRKALVGDLWMHFGTSIFPTPSHPSQYLPEAYRLGHSHDPAMPVDLKAWPYVLVRDPSGKSAPSAPYALVTRAGEFALFRRPD